jgi:hypothetical protein
MYPYNDIFATIEKKPKLIIGISDDEFEIKNGCEPTSKIR